MKSLIIILSIISTSRAITFNCTFGYVMGPNLPSTYSCYNPIITNLNECDHLTAITGQHHDGKTNDDVKLLGIYNNPQLAFFPRAIENFFPNLEAISIWNSNISTLNGDELNPFKNLSWLSFTFSPNLEKIPGNLFKSTPLMKHISFQSNNIKHVEEGLFGSLPKLIFLDFHQNYCVDRNASGIAAVRSLIAHLNNNCTGIDVTTTTKHVTSTRVTTTTPVKTTRVTTTTSPVRSTLSSTTTTKEPTCGDTTDLSCNLLEQNKLLIEMNAEMRKEMNQKLDKVLEGINECNFVHH